MISAHEVSAVIVTRGDVDLTPILDRLPFTDIVIWNNAERSDVKVYGRYAGILDAKHDTIYVQDDDCLVPAGTLLEQYEPGERLCNMPASRTDYTDSALLGWGAIFPRSEPALSAFNRYRRALGHQEGWEMPDEFLRCCDVVFTTLCPFRRIDLGHENLPWATASNRMYTGEPDHYAIRARVLGEARRIRNQLAA